MGLGPSTQVSAQPSKQQRPLLGQSREQSRNIWLTQSVLPSSPVSLWPGLQQLETAPAHSSGARLGAGHSPTSPSEPAPESPKAPAAASYSPVEAAQSTLNLEISDFTASADLHHCQGGVSVSVLFRSEMLGPEP